MMSEAHKHMSLWVRTHARWMAMLATLVICVILAYRFIASHSVSYPVIPLPTSVTNPVITIGDNNTTITLVGLSEWMGYLKLLTQQGWRPCTPEICGFIDVTDTKFDVAYYYEQESPRSILVLYSPSFSGGVYMDLLGCGHITQTTIPAAPSIVGCTILLPATSSVR